MKKCTVVVSVLSLAGFTMVSAEETRMETPETDCLIWWRLGSPLTAYYCLTSVNASCPGANILDSSFII